MLTIDIFLFHLRLKRFANIRRVGGTLVRKESGEDLK